MVVNEIKIRVSYADTDKMGVTYYGRYFEYFEKGRTELLRELGMRYSKMEDNGISLPVIEAHCEYKKWIEYDQIIVVKTFLKELPKSCIKMDYQILDGREKTLLAKGYTIHPFVNKDGKPVKPPKDFIELIKEKL